jgi:hypothetical protein|tara:strand:- start:49 stop:513 length:465 start_codon:yes stop_codon:yes gene_type:complete
MAGKLNKKKMLAICDELADGKSLNSICKRDDMPHRVTVLQAVQRDDELYEMYARARAIGAETLADEIHDVSRQGLESVDKQMANAEVQRRRLQVDSLKWTYARQQPRGLRNKAEDTAQNNQIVLSWSKTADDVTARQADEDDTATVINLVGEAS